MMAIVVRECVLRTYMLSIRTMEKQVSNAPSTSCSLVGAQHLVTGLLDYDDYTRRPELVVG
jgi:hypothetical protein